MLPTLTIAANIQRMETKTTQSGSTVTTLSLSAGDKNKEGNYDNLYLDASFWNQQSEFITKHFKEGSAIIVTGKLITTNYTKADGSKIYKTQFHFPQASFAPKDREAPQQPSNQYQGYQQQPQQGHSTSAGMNNPSPQMQQQYNQQQNPPAAQHLPNQNQNTMPQQQYNPPQQTVPGSQIPLEISEESIPF